MRVLSFRLSDDAIPYDIIPHPLIFFQDAMRFKPRASSFRIVKLSGQVK
jgi:hypothetical protein